MRINRESFLHDLESVEPGLSKREIVEQSSCYVFQNGRILTYNDEIACRIKGPFAKDFTGAVPHEPLLNILRKLAEEEIEVSNGDGELLIVGKARRAGIRMEAEVNLPIANVELPKTWRELPAEFADAVRMVQHCASTDDSQFHLTCLHLHPDWIEACDNYQICRWNLKTGVEKSLLVRQSAIKHVVSLGMTELAETDAWIHFRNPKGLILSCRRYAEDFPDLTKFLRVDGTPTTLPKGLVEAAEKAQIFSSENPEADRVVIELTNGKLRIKSVGVTGWYRETKKVVYNGEPLTFRIAPQILIDLVKQHNDFVLTPDRLKVAGQGNYTYVTCLGKPEGDSQVPVSQGEAHSAKPKKRRGDKEEAEK